MGIADCPRCAKRQGRCIAYWCDERATAGSLTVIGRRVHSLGFCRMHDIPRLIDMSYFTGSEGVPAFNRDEVLRLIVDMYAIWKHHCFEPPFCRDAARLWDAIEAECIERNGRPTKHRRPPSAFMPAPSALVQ